MTTMTHVTPVILCGGSGTRLWPLSRTGFPKQFLCLTGNESLFQQAAQRLAVLANAINIIDGFNGLASTLGFVGYALIAWQVGDTTLTSVSIILAACVWGFFGVNGPFGKLFLGDGSSYFIGFALAWVAVLLMEGNPGVSAFAVLTVCVRPITNVLYSIFRRKVRKDHPGMPDRLHFHSLFKRHFVARWFGQYSNSVRNSITGSLIGFMTLTAFVLASLTHASFAWSVAAFFGLSLWGMWPFVPA
jgi:UDP-N-acetylmuramyl pentapeptide phosphotransferase/UDP-N-acetylglucosamine-1-phosphate transferase